MPRGVNVVDNDKYPAGGLGEKWCGKTGHFAFVRKPEPFVLDSVGGEQVRQPVERLESHCPELSVGIGVGVRDAHPGEKP